MHVDGMSMEPLSNVRWPWKLGKHLRGITQMTVPDRSGALLAKTEYVDVHPDDLRWCRPVDAVESYSELVELIAQLAGGRSSHD